jgi:hypothetical protein
MDALRTENERLRELVEQGGGGGGSAVRARLALACGWVGGLSTAVQTAVAAAAAAEAELQKLREDLANANTKRQRLQEVRPRVGA